MSHATTMGHASRCLPQLPRDNGFFLSPVQLNLVTPPLAENSDVRGRAILTLDCWDWMGSLSHHPEETGASPCHHSCQTCWQQRRGTRRKRQDKFRNVQCCMPQPGTAMCPGQQPVLTTAGCWSPSAWRRWEERSW